MSGFGSTDFGCGQIIRGADPDPDLQQKGPDQDSVGYGPLWSDPDPDVWDRIRIMALINDPISTFLVCVKALHTLLNFIRVRIWIRSKIVRIRNTADNPFKIINF
jgi:hypothetical protein